MMFQCFSYCICIYQCCDCITSVIPLVLLHQFFVIHWFTQSCLIEDGNHNLSVCRFCTSKFDFELSPLVIYVVTLARNEVFHAKGTPILASSRVNESDISIVTPITPTKISRIVR